MPAFELEQVDGGDPIDVPYGNTVLGRGPFLGVSDKRVSRNHAILENLDGQLSLKPTHTNPCFIQASLEAPPQPLEKDQWHCLREGSTFSLLPGKYIFRVHAVSQDGTPRNSQGYEEEAGMMAPSKAEETPKPSRLCEETLAYTPQAKSEPPLTPTSTQMAHCKHSETGTRPPSLPSCSQVAGEASISRTAEPSTPGTTQKKRVLPSWMMAATPAAVSSSPVKGAAKQAPSRSTPNPSRPNRAARPKKARARLRLSDEEEEGEEDSEVVQMPRKRARRLKSDPDDSQVQAHVSPGDGVSQEPAVANTEEEEEVKGRGRKRAEVSPRTKDTGSPTAMEDSRNPQANEQPSLNGCQRSKVVESSSKAQQRTPCPYGNSCYRKNPIHFQECSHPGDDDYEEDGNNEGDGDGDDDRPECPYGTDCYRKNPLHKKEYKHTKPPVKTLSGEDDDDEDHYEDSFINDESEEEEGDEGSDYVPESDDSGKEDVKQLKKEAKAFLRRRKN